MKRIFTFLLCWLMVGTMALQAQNANEYRTSVFVGTYTPITGTFLTTSGTLLGNAILTLPAPFNFCGTYETSIVCGIHGHLAFGSSTPRTSQMNGLASSSYYNSLAPFWEDLAALTTNGSISWLLDVTDPTDSTLIIQYQNVYRKSNSSELLNFQVKLHYATGKIEFVYGAGFDNITVATTTASIGINNRTDNTTHFISITPTGPGTMSYSTTTANDYINHTTAAYIVPGTTYAFEKSTCMAFSNLAFSNFSSNAATITWDENNDVLGWMVSYMAAGGSWSDEEFVTTHEYVWGPGSLTPSTQYTFRGRTVCDIADTGNYVFKTFTTPCTPVAVPFMENFDGPEFTTGLNGQTPCWKRITNYTGGQQNITTAQAASATKSFHFRGYDATYEYFVSPGVNPDVNPLHTLKVKFNLLSTNSGTASQGVQVGVMTDPGDITTFVPVGNCHKSSSVASFEQKEQSLAAYQGTGAFIAFRTFGSGSTSSGNLNTNYIDDVEIETLSSCEAPREVTVTDIRSNQAMINWELGNAADDSWWIYYKPALAANWDSILVSTRPYPLQGLLGTETYQVKISTDCAAGISAYSNMRTFTTACEPLSTLPVTENFDSYGYGPSAMPTCWLRTTTYTNRPCIDTVSGTNNCLSFYTVGAGLYNIAVMPMIAENIDISNLKLSFRYKANSSTRDTLRIGIMSDPADASTFEEVAWVTGTTTWTQKVVSLLSYTGTGHYIAFRINSRSSTSIYSYIDDLEIDYFASCLRPTNLTATEISEGAMELSWDNAGTTVPTSWIVRYTYNNLPYIYQEVQTNPCELYDLPQNSVLTISVAAICNGTDTSRYSEPQTLALSCSPVMQFPWVESFEGAWWPGDGLTPSESVSRRWCWINTDGGSTTYRWQANGNMPYQGTGAMYSNATTSSVPVFSDWAITPVISLSQNQYLRFHARGSHAMDTFNVQILDVFSEDMTSHSDTANFTLLAGIKPEIGVYGEYEIDLSSYSGDFRIAFHRNRGGGSIYIDEIVIDNYASCIRASDLYFENAYAESVDVGWTSGSSSDGAWWVYYKPMGSEAWDSTRVTSNPATLYSLEPSTAYEWYVKTDCGSLISESSISSIFRTACDPISSFPWVEGFEADWFPAAYVGDKPAPHCWTVIDKGTTTGAGSSQEYWWSQTTVAAYTRTGNGAAQCYTDHGAPGTAHNDWLITPLINLTGYEKLSFWARRATPTSIEPDEIAIFISDEDIALDTLGMGAYGDMPGFQRIFHQDLSTGDWTKYELNLNQYPGNRYIAFVRQGNPDGQALRLDDVSIETLPDCAPPHSVVVTDVAPTTVEIDFLPGNLSDNEWYLYYKTSEASVYDSVYVFSTPTQLASLTANTTYQFYLKTDCGNERSEATNSYTFHTPCNFITISFIENFDAFSTGTSAETPCWVRGTNHSTQGYPCVESTHSVSSSNSLYFYGYNSTYEYAAAPPVDINTNPINTLKVKFKILSTTANAASVGLQVGVMTNPEDYSTFEPVGGLHKSSTTTQFEEVAVSLASYAGTGRFIAIRSTGTGTANYYNYTYVDDFEIVELADCEQPDIALSNATDHSVDISIAAGNAGDHTWMVYYKPVSATNWNSVSTSINPFTLSTLQPSTSYQIYVKTVCDTELSLPSAIRTVQTACGAFTSLPIVENFDSYGTGESVMPACWSRATQINRPCISAGGVTAHCLYLHADTIGMMSIAVMPAIDVFAIPINTVTLSFGSRAFANTGSDTLYVGVMTDPADASTFELVEKIYNTGQYENHEISFSNYTGVGEYIAFKVESHGTTSYAYLDDLMIDATSNCPNPQNFSAAQNSATSVALYWDEEPGVVSRTLEYKLSTDATWIDDPNVTAPPYTLSSLDPASAYNFRLKLGCGGTDESNFKYIDFELCDVISSLPFNENFDTYGTGETVMPSCWTKITTFGNRPYVSSGGVTSNCLSFSAGNPGTYNIAALPLVDASISIPALQLSFESRTLLNSGVDTLYVGVMTNPSDASTFELVEVIFNTREYTLQNVSFGNYVGSGRYIAFKVACNGNVSYAYVDNLALDLMSNCPNPQNFTAMQHSLQSVQLDWDEDPSVFSRTLEYKLTADATWTDAPGVTAPPFVVSSLVAGNSYDFRLKLHCSATEVSNFKYTTISIGDYCAPAFTGSSTNYYTRYVVTSGATTTNLADSTVCTPLTYYDRTALPFNAAPGDQLSFTATYAGGSHGMAIWIDYNQNNAFESAELIYSTSTYYSTPHTGMVTIPAATAEGAYRVRVQLDGSNSTPSNPCQNNTGNIIDYEMVVERVILPCHSPAELAVSNVTHQSAMISWTAGGTETAWIVEHRKGSDSYARQTVTQPTAPLLNLEPETEYDVRVKAVCGIGDESDYAEITFTSEVAPVYYTITPSVSGNGTISPSTPQQVIAGGSLLFNFSPNDGYQVDKVLINNMEEDWNAGDNSYQFANVQQDYTIEVVFAVGIEDYTLSHVVTIYPNPTDDVLHVKTDAPFQTVEITNLLGQVIYRATISDVNFSLNVSSFNAGVYFLKLSGENGNAVKKFVVN